MKKWKWWLVACALSSLNKEAARKYKIEESTIRAWVKKLERGSELAVAPKRGYFQQKYSQQVSITLNNIESISLLSSQVMFLCI